MAEQSLRELVPDWDRLPMPDVAPPRPVNVARRWLIFLVAPLLVWAGFAGYGVYSLAQWQCGAYIGSKIPASVSDDRTSAIWWFDGAGNSCRRVIKDGGSWNPVVSPDGRHIAYSSHAGMPGPAINSEGIEGAATVHVADVDGSHQRQLTSSADRPIAWSPDSSQLASCQGVGATSQIIVSDLSGAETTVPGAPCTWPAAWANHSLLILETHHVARVNLEESWQLVAVDVRTGARTTVIDLGRHGELDYAVDAWNSRHVAAVEVVDAHVELHVIDVATGADRMLARTPAGSRKPSVDSLQARFWTGDDRLVWARTGQSLFISAPGGVGPSTRIGADDNRRGLVDNPAQS